MIGWEDGIQQSDRGWRVIGIQQYHMVERTKCLESMYVVTDKVEVKKIVNCCLVSWYCTAKWVVTTMFDIHTLFLFANSYIEIKKDCILLFGILRHGCLVWVFALFLFFFPLSSSLSLFFFLNYKYQRGLYDLGKWLIVAYLCKSLY